MRDAATCTKRPSPFCFNAPSVTIHLGFSCALLGTENRAHGNAGRRRFLETSVTTERLNDLLYYTRRLQTTADPGRCGQICHCLCLPYTLTITAYCRTKRTTGFSFPESPSTERMHHRRRRRVGGESEKIFFGQLLCKIRALFRQKSCEIREFC